VSEAARGEAIGADYGLTTLLNCSISIKEAYFASVESQLKTAKDELSTLYKTQSQNAQKLINLNEQMREKDDRERDTGEEVRRLNDEMTKVKRKEGDLRSVVGEKDKMIQVRLDTMRENTLNGSQILTLPISSNRCYRMNCLRFLWS
jgi:DNA repair exonuclease SbcCD ATPase subunit